MVRWKKNCGTLKVSEQRASAEPPFNTAAKPENDLLLAGAIDRRPRQRTDERARRGDPSFQFSEVRRGIRKCDGLAVTIFDEIAQNHADLMITNSSETRYQQKLHAGVLCAVHPDKPFDFAEKAYWLQRDPAFKAFVDQWLHMSMEDGSFQKIYAAWFE